MRGAWIIGAAAAALTAGAAQAEVIMNGVVARVVVIPENRADYAVQVQPGRGSVPAPRVRREGQRLVVDGGLRVRQCNSNGGSVQVRIADVGRIDMAEAPLITVRAPRNVSLQTGGNGALSGQIGPTQNLSLSSGGCSNWKVGDVAGTLNITQSGGSSATVGQARVARVNASGGGTVSLTRVGDLQADSSGGGVVRVGTVAGPMRAEASGGGGVRVAGGQTGVLRASASGGGWVDYDGSARELDANASGGGRVKVARVTGAVRRSASGGGSIRVGN